MKKLTAEESRAYQDLAIAAKRVQDLKEQKRPAAKHGGPRPGSGRPVGEHGAKKPLTIKISPDIREFLDTRKPVSCGSYVEQMIRESADFKKFAKK